MLELTKENYQKEVIESGLPVLVDFWSIRCDKCVVTFAVLRKMEEKPCVT